MKTNDWLTLPNAISVVRLLLVIPIAILLAQDAAPITTAVLLALFGTSDWIDGFLARRMGQTSGVGELLDPVADRLGVVVIITFLVIGGHVPAWIVIVVAATDLTLGVLTLSLRPESTPKVNWLGKIRTAVLMSGIALVALGRIPELSILAPAALIIISVGALLHAIAGLVYGAAIIRSPRRTRHTRADESTTGNE